jgi:hypothetical protein
MSLNNPTCPTGCDSFLVDVDFNYCDPDVQFGEIDHIYLKARDGSDLLDWESLAIWTARLALDPTADNDAVIDLTVMADAPPAETEEIEISDGRKIQSPSTFVINFDIDDVSDDNYELMRWLECNLVVDMWYSANEVIFGGNPGIEVTLSAKYQIERGQKSLQKIVGTAKWESKFSPPRTANPMA